MRITFKLSRRDLFCATVRAVLHQPVLLALIGIALLFFVYQGVTVIDPEIVLWARVVVLLILTLIPAVVIFFVVATVLFLILMSKKNAPLLSQQTVEIGDQSLRVETEYVKAEISWSGVQQVHKGRSWLFVDLSALNVLVIPRRAFESSEAWDRFIQILRQRSKEASGKGG